MKKGHYALLMVMNIFLIACNSQKKELQKMVGIMKSSTIIVPYDRMDCWTSDSIKKESPWMNAKLKLVHYIDSATCSSCYLQKIAHYEVLFQMERLSNNEFYNVFIASPKGNAKMLLESSFRYNTIPPTIFVDTSNVFMQFNPNVPSELMYHTFLLDEENKVILVGNPYVNEKIENMLTAIVEEKLGKKINIKNGKPNKN